MFAYSPDKLITPMPSISPDPFRTPGKQSVPLNNVCEEKQKA